MSPTATLADSDALDAEARRLMAAFTGAGYERIAPAVIQPAGLFLDVIGESLRGRTYVFSDPDGEELCLRPDLTVPTCRWHLERHPGGRAAARYCYSGSAFRYQPVGADSAHPREFHQAGIESFGVADREADDAAVLVLILEALRTSGPYQRHRHAGTLAAAAEEQVLALGCIPRRAGAAESRPRSARAGLAGRARTGP